MAVNVTIRTAYKGSRLEAVVFGRTVAYAHCAGVEPYLVRWIVHRGDDGPILGQYGTRDEALLALLRVGGAA